MDSEQIVQQVRQFIQGNFVYGQADPISDDDSFLEGGIIDSTGILELIAFLSQQYSIVVSDEEAVPDNLDSISRVSAFVVRKRNGAGRIS